MTLFDSGRMPRFTLKQLLVLIASIAFVLAGLHWLHSMLSIDPASETVTVLGEVVSVPWTEAKYESGKTGVGVLSSPTISASNPGAANAGQKFDQRLVTVSYDNCFGKPAFTANIAVFGHFNEDWSEFTIIPSHTGGGIVDGACRATFEFDPGNKTLTVLLKQVMNHNHTARETTLRFVHDGDAFEYKK